MNDRFRFRAWVVGHYFSENDEEKEILVKINDVTVYNDGIIGIDYHSLLESVCSFLKDEGERDSLIEYFEDKNCTTGDDWYYLEAKFIEQCTGLKDKNGRLVYEGDLFELEEDVSDTIREVVWDKNTASFKVSCRGKTENNNGLYNEIEEYEELLDLSLFLDCACIIGNIHEHGGLLNEN